MSARGTAARTAQVTSAATLCWTSALASCASALRNDGGHLTRAVPAGSRIESARVTRSKAPSKTERSRSRHGPSRSMRKLACSATPSLLPLAGASSTYTPPHLSSTLLFLFQHRQEDHRRSNSTPLPSLSRRPALPLSVVTLCFRYREEASWERPLPSLRALAMGALVCRHRDPRPRSVPSALFGPIMYCVHWPRCLRVLCCMQNGPRLHGISVSKRGAMH